MSVRRAVVRAIPNVEGRVKDQGAIQILGPVKETLDLREGRTGLPLEKYVLFRDLVDLGLTNASGTAAGSSVSRVSALYLTEMYAGVGLDRFTMVALAAAGTLEAADPTDTDHAAVVMGILAEGVAAGSKAVVLRRGLISSAAWAWTPRAPLFLGAGGTITATVPTTGFHLQIGAAKAKTTVLIDISTMPVLL